MLLGATFRNQWDPPAFYRDALDYIVPELLRAYGPYIDSITLRFALLALVAACTQSDGPNSSRGQQYAQLARRELMKRLSGTIDEGDMIAICLLVVGSEENESECRAHINGFIAISNHLYTRSDSHLRNTKLFNLWPVLRQIVLLSTPGSKAERTMRDFVTRYCDCSAVLPPNNYQKYNVYLNKPILCMWQDVFFVWGCLMYVATFGGELGTEIWSLLAQLKDSLNRVFFDRITGGFFRFHPRSNDMSLPVQGICWCVCIGINLLESNFSPTGFSSTLYDVEEILNFYVEHWDDWGEYVIFEAVIAMASLAANENVSELQVGEGNEFFI